MSEKTIDKPYFIKGLRIEGTELLLPAIELGLGRVAARFGRLEDGTTKIMILYTLESVVDVGSVVPDDAKSDPMTVFLFRNQAAIDVFRLWLDRLQTCFDEGETQENDQ